MHDHRPRLTAALALAAVASAALLWWAPWRSEPPPPSAPPAIARDQLFFVGHDPEPVLAALVVQRSPTDAGGAAVELKAFLGWRGEWKPAFYERVELAGWPGDGLGDAIDAWAATREGRPLRLSYSTERRGLRLSVRRPNGGLRLSASSLADAGEGDDPYGRVRWRAGPGSLRVNGREVEGVVVAETITEATTAWPTFGRFEMWLLALPDGTAALARQRAGGAAKATALLVPPSGGPPRRASFQATPQESRKDSETGFALPSAWTVRLDDQELSLSRAGGETGRGRSPDDTPAVYDISLARSESGAAALVFHLQD